MNRSHPATTLVVTCGVSLLSNLGRLKHVADLSREVPSFIGIDPASWEAWIRPAQGVVAMPSALAAELHGALRVHRSLGARILGAEANSIASTIEAGHVVPDCRVVLCCSESLEGDQVAMLLTALLEGCGHDVQHRRIVGLDGSDADRFARVGLRNLAKELCGIVREWSPTACVIDATGGYKAQIAVAVQIGQALQVPVVYRHESFPRTIVFPALPITLDLRVGRRASFLFRTLEACPGGVPWSEFEDVDWDEAFEALVDRVVIDGVEYLDLSPAGQIFREACRDEHITAAELPPPAAKQRPPRFETAGWPGKHPALLRTIEKLTTVFPQIVQAQSRYYMPDLNKPARAYLKARQIWIDLPDRGATAKFSLDTTGDEDPRALEALLVRINEWIAERARG